MKSLIFWWFVLPVNNCPGVFHVWNKSKAERGHGQRNNGNYESDPCDYRENQNVDCIHNGRNGINIHQNCEVR